MLTALVGALVGGVINAAAYLIARAIARKKIDWGILAGSFVGGAVSGALAGATFGLGWLGAGGLKTFGWLAATSAAGSGAQDVATNVATGHPVLQGVLGDMAVSAGEGVALYGGTRLLVKVLPEVKPLVGQSAEQQASRLRQISHRVKYARSSHAALAIALGNATQGWFGSLAGSVASGVAPQAEAFACKLAPHAPPPVKGIAERLCEKIEPKKPTN